MERAAEAGEGSLPDHPLRWFRCDTSDQLFRRQAGLAYASDGGEYTIRDPRYRIQPLLDDPGPITDSSEEGAQYSDGGREEGVAECIQEVLRDALEDIERLYREGIDVVCPDGKIRTGHPVFGAWLADYEEYYKLFTQKHMSCPVCEAYPEELDAFPTAEFAPRNSELVMKAQKRLKAMEDIKEEAQQKYQAAPPKSKEEANELRRWEEANEAVARTLGWFRAKQVLPVSNFLWSMPSASPKVLWNPDLLHTMDLGMIKHLIEWCFKFLDSYRPLAEVFDTLWLSVSPHPSIKRPNKTYRSIKQKTGMEFRNAARLLGTLMEATLASYEPPNDTAGAVMREFSDALDCTSTFLDFHLMAQYKSHTYKATGFDPSDITIDPKSSLSYLHNYLYRFHEKKDVFRQFRASKKVKAAAQEAGREAVFSEEILMLMNPQEAERERIAAPQKSKMAEREYLEQHSDFSFIKMHLTSHFSPTIPMFGTLPQFSSRFNEVLQKPYKGEFKKTNKNETAMDQVLRRLRHAEALAMKVAKLRLLLERDTGVLSKETKKDIRFWLECFASKKERDRSARICRDKLSPKSESSMRRRQREEERRRMEREFERLGRELDAGESQLVEGLDYESDDSESEAEDGQGQQSDDEPLEDFQGFDEEDGIDRRPTMVLRRRLANKTLAVTMKIEGKDTKIEVATVKDIEEALHIEGFTKAVMHHVKIQERRGGGLKSLEEYGDLTASLHLSLVIPRPVFQQGDTWEKQIVRCTAGMPFRKKKARSDFIAYRDERSNARSIIGQDQIARVLAFFALRLPPLTDAREDKGEVARFAAIRPMEFANVTASQRKRGVVIVAWHSSRKIDIIRIGCIQRPVCVIPIHPAQRPTFSTRYQRPDESNLYEHNQGFILNTRVDPETFNEYYYNFPERSRKRQPKDMGPSYSKSNLLGRREQS